MTDKQPHNPLTLRSHLSRDCRIGVCRVFPWFSGLLVFVLATSWASLENPLCLCPPPATAAASSLSGAVNYAGAFGQDLIISTCTFFFLLWTPLTKVPGWKVLDKQEQLGSLEESCQGMGFFYPLGDRNSQMKSFLFLLGREVQKRASLVPPEVGMALSTQPKQ